MINIPKPNIMLIAVTIDTTRAFPFLESDTTALKPYAPPPFQDSHHLTYNAVRLVYHVFHNQTDTKN